MPSSESFLTGLRTIANEWALLAILWHVFFGLLLVALAAGWRPEKRDFSLYLLLPLISVSALAWLYFNPFTGTLMAVVGLFLLVVSQRLGRETVMPGPAWMSVAGAVLVAFGWFYPHFLATQSWLPYLYRAPTGLLPSPTLAMVLGLTLIVGGFQSRVWTYTLAMVSGFYGLFGAAYLSLGTDLVLVGGAIAAAVAARQHHETSSAEQG